MKEIQDPWQPIPLMRRRIGNIRDNFWDLYDRIFSANTTPAFLPPLINYDDGSCPYIGTKRALLVYVRNTFNPNGLSTRTFHSNQEQTIEIYRAFRRLGYSVDIVDYRDLSFIPSVDYDVFFGMGENAERITKYLKPETIKIYYGTGSYWEYEKEAEQARRDQFQLRRGRTIPQYKFPSKNDWAKTADALILLCNQYTTNTYPNIFRKVYSIDNSFVSCIPVPNMESKNFSEARKNFFWMGGRNLLMRGLDLVLEAFVNLPNYHLWICGPLQNLDEQEFLKTYRKELFHTSNIHPLGYIDLFSDAFHKATDLCAGFIYASCTESMSGSALNCMRRGLIPLVTRTVGIDVREEFGLVLESDTVECIRESVINFTKLHTEQIRDMSELVLNEVNGRYTLDAFARNIESILSEVLNGQ